MLNSAGSVASIKVASIISEPTAAQMGLEDDDWLVERARTDRRAFAILYSRHVTAIYRYSYRRLGSREAAEDATSQVFVKALAALPSYRTSSFVGWLFAIARNVIADVYQSGRPAKPLDDALDVVDDAPTPEETALRADAARQLQRWLADLTPEQRSVVELRLAGLAGAEIAAALERSLGSVKMLQVRAIARMRALLQAEQTGEEAQYGAR